MPYLGNQHIVGDSVHNFKVLDDISSYTETFDGSASSVVSTSDETIRVVNHRFVQGQRVTYNNGGGGNIGGLSSGTAYYVTYDSASTIKLATTLANANNNTNINLTSVGSGSAHTLTAAFDGVNKKFRITHDGGTRARFSQASQLRIAINNVIQKANNDHLNFSEGYAIDVRSIIVFQTAPTVNDIFFGDLLGETLGTFDVSDHKIDNHTGDGSTVEFSLSRNVPNVQSLLVTLDGVLQHASDATTSRAYSLIADNIIQFTGAPASGVQIQIRHLGFAGASTGEVSGFYGRTGNVTLGVTDNISIGDISTSRNINATGIVTASSFVGDGSGLIGVASTDNIVTGTAATFNTYPVDINAGMTVAGVSTFQDIDVDGHTNLDNVNVAGVVTFASAVNMGTLTASTGSFSGNVTIGGTLTYEDVTNIDSVGVITAKGADVNGDLDVDGHTNLDNVSIAGVTTFSDDVVVNFGTGNDLQIYHTSSTNRSYIKEVGSGGFYLQAANLNVMNPAGNETLLRAIPDGAVELYHDNIKHFETTNIGCKIYDNDTTAALQFQNSAGIAGLIMGESTNIIGFKDSNPHWLVKCIKDGAVELYHDNAKKLETSSTGVTVTGNVDAGTGGFLLSDDGRIRIGTGFDFEFYHDGSHSIINDSAGSLLVRSNVVQISTPAGSKYFKGQNGIANLYYSDSKKLETSAKGIKVGTGVTIETNGQATFVGVVTFGSGSTTIDDNVVNVGTALTLGHTQGLQFHTQNLHAQGFEVNQINASGIVTASSFSGSVAASNLTGTIPTARLGSGTANSSTFLRGDSTFAVVDTALVADTSPQLGGNLDVNTKNIVFGDSGSSSDDRLIFGAGSDLQIYHNANNNKTYIGNKTSTDLLIENAGTNTDIVDDTGHYRARFIKDGEVQLYCDNVRRLRVTTGGISVNATDAGGSEHWGRFYFKQESGTVRGLFDPASQKFQIYDNSQFTVGNDHDAVFHHDGSNTYLLNNTGNLFIRNDGSSTSEEILIQPKGGEHSIRAIANQGVQLYYNNVVKAQTNAGSWQVHGDVISEPNVGNSDAGFRGYPEGSAVYTWFRGYSSDGAHNAGMITHSGQTLYLDSSNNAHIYVRAHGTGNHYFQTNSTNRMTINANNIFLPDSQVINFGAGNDLQIHHDSSDSYISSGTGNFVIQHTNNSGDFIMKANDFYLRSNTNENYFRGQVDGSVQLFHDNSSRLTTTSTGVTLDGTGAFIPPIGTTAQRPSGSTGMVRYNSTTGQLEVYDGSAWKNVNSQPFEASGGSTSSSSRSGYKVHTFTSPGTFTVSGDDTTKTVEVLVIGGGGAGGEGGGGAGALRFSNSYPVSPGNYSVSIGGGGSGNQAHGNNGSSSSFGNFTAPGGGGGGGHSRSNGNPGGSGGGTRRDNGGSRGNASGASGGSNNSNSPSSGWGNRGGSGNVGNWCGGGGGGGAGGVGGQGNGGSPNGERGGPGGSGLAYSINGSSTTRAGGGGGGCEGAGNPSGPGRATSVNGGGGRGGVSNQVPGSFGASAGSSNTGGGGGGNASTGYSGGNHSGGSGIVIVAYTT